MHKISLPLAINILCNPWKEILQIGNYLIKSLNAENCIIGRGNSTATRSWFLIEIFSKVTNIEIDVKKAIYPKKESYFPYNDVLKIWNTEDMDILDKNLYMLCENHLSLALSLMDEENEKERQKDFEIPCFQLFPYEILAWLKLRERAGLRNPKIFSHPLMNTPITKMFLKLKEPLPKPKELPFAKELLEKLKEKCPDVEIPVWLEDINAEKEKDIKTTSAQAIEKKEEKIEVGNEIIKSNQIVQKSGTYQAFLPQSHPLAKKVHQMSESKRLGIKGISMLPLGLSSEDEEQLRWEWIGE